MTLKRMIMIQNIVGVNLNREGCRGCLEEGNSFQRPASAVMSIAQPTVESSTPT